MANSVDAPSGSADAARIDALRAMLDQGAAGYGDAARSALEEGRKRLRDQASAIDLDACVDQIRAARDQVASLRPQALTPRRGVAGLFDSRSARLKRFRTAFVGARKGLQDIASDLRDRLTGVEARHHALEQLWKDCCAATDDVAAHGAALTTWMAGRSAPDDTSDPFSDLRHKAEGLMRDARHARRGPALVRALQNADVGVKASADTAVSAVDDWLSGWTQALGLDQKRPRKVRPDPVDMGDQTHRLTAALEDAEHALNQARARRREILARMG